MLKVGFTFDLKDDYLAQGFSNEQAAEFDSLETIEFISQALQSNGYAVEKIGGIKNLVQALAEQRHWDIVFNICEGVKGLGRESQVPALLEAYNVPYVFSSSDVMVTTMDKSLAKLVVQHHGLATAKFSVVQSEQDIKKINLDFPLFVKPLAEGTGKGISDRSLVHNFDELNTACKTILNQFHHPALVETFLSGRDFTVGLLGSASQAQVIAVMEVKTKSGSEGEGQSFFNKEHCETVLEYQIVEDDVATKVSNLALACWQVLKCNDAGRVDIRCDAMGVPYFLEVNPMAGLHPSHSDLPILASKMGIDHVQLIGKIMQHALSRYGLA